MNYSIALYANEVGRYNSVCSSMATTVASGFSGFQANLEITDLQAGTISTRQQNVRKVIEEEFDVLDSFLAGSYMRNTLIGPLTDADVDICVVLDPKYWSADGSQAALLDRVKRALLKTYTKTPKVSRNGQAVTITFTDFNVDVVPCFYRNGGGYLIPDSVLGRWLPTDPKAHITLWSEANKAHAYDLIPLMKMLKGWNKRREVVTSFHLEVLALRVLEGIRIDDFPGGVRYVFDKAREKIRFKLADPAGYSDDVAAQVNTDAKMSAIIAALDTAYARAKAAEELAAEGKIKEAFDKWRLLFGDYFPAYGCYLSTSESAAQPP